jgi:hypothetical protein
MRTLDAHTADELVAHWRRRGSFAATRAADQFDLGVAQAYRVAADELEAVLTVAKEQASCDPPYHALGCTGHRS